MGINPDIEKLIMTQLQDVKDPETGRSIAKSKQIYEINELDDEIQVKVGLTSFALPLKQDFEQSVEDAVQRACPDI